jgi:hypothetical protein
MIIFFKKVVKELQSGKILVCGSDKWHINYIITTLKVMGYMARAIIVRVTTRVQFLN